MARSLNGQRKRIGNLKARIASNADDHFPRCTIIGCGRPTARAAKQGLSATLCRKHLLHRQRHGSPWCATPAAKALTPYLRAAGSFIHLNRGDPYISHAVAALESLMASAGPVEIATRLRGLPAERRAKIDLARIRESGIHPERLLAIAMAVHALIEEAPQAVHRVKEWRIVAIAKAAHRNRGASGYHQRWTFVGVDGRLCRTELHAYPRSAGRVLRYLGQSIERECEWVIEKHLAAVVVLKVKNHGRHPAVADPLQAAAPPNYQAHR